MRPIRAIMPQMQRLGWLLSGNKSAVEASMYPTYIGAILIPIATYIYVRCSVSAMLGFMLICSLMGGAAAIAVPALGGSSIPPAYVGLGFLLLRAVAPGTQQTKAIPVAMVRNFWLMLFAVYGVAIAIIGPRLFAGQLDVTPMRATDLKHLYETKPLGFSSQNI